MHENNATETERVPGHRSDPVVRASWVLIPDGANGAAWIETAMDIADGVPADLGGEG